jgi:hypothetical protein
MLDIVDMLGCHISHVASAGCCKTLDNVALDFVHADAYIAVDDSAFR